MSNKSLQTLNDMYEDLKKDYSKCLEELTKKKNRIEEIDIYLDSLLNKEESDLQVFLPRKVETVYHDVIEKNRSEKEKLIYECDDLEKRNVVTKNRMEELEQILKTDTLFFQEKLLKQLSVLDVQEIERQRIARDLHDTSLQDLAHLVHKIELAFIYVDEDTVKAKLELATIEKGLRKVIDNIRNSIFNIRPMSFDDLGMKETLERLFPALNQDGKFIVKTSIDDIKYENDNSEEKVVLMSIYRIIQECFQNAVKHSEGTEIFVSLKQQEDKYSICIKDNGKGFDMEKACAKDKHFGLSVIKERVFLLNGNIQIDSQDGTVITIEIPRNQNVEGRA